MPPGRILASPVPTLAAALVACAAAAAAAPPVLDADAEALCAAVDPKVVDWRRDFHQHPELSNREVRTAARVAEHLQGLGIEVQTGVAHTGVVGILRGGRPGPVIALRADMDALPVSERSDLPFASRETATYEGREVGVMHACGHDAHVAILMGTAEVLAAMRESLPGTVKFLFQPAEEGAPRGEEGGAEMMVKEGVLRDPDVEAAFALHIDALSEVGTLGYRPGGIWASVDDFRILVKGRQSHGAYPWMGVDPVVAAAQIITALQTIVSRNLPLIEGAAVVTVGSIHGGVRSNIVPEEVELIGTLRALDEGMRATIHERLRSVATGVAEGMGATVEIAVPYSSSYPVTVNDPELTAAMVPALESVAGAERVVLIPAETGAEDFAYFAQQVPGFYFTLGARPADVPREQAADHHTPDFFIDEGALPLGVRAMTAVALHYLQTHGGQPGAM
ncbi:MAG TPA: amidohydrolase [Thermoanaerobaculia bacterium]|nr:amidohydrolase [Thermoanaerobaculia bacterium]